MKKNIINKKKTNLIKLITQIFVLVFVSAGVFSAGGINVILNSQNPDPALPGGFVFANIKISNTGSTPVQNVKVQIEENKVLKVAPGEDNPYEIGTIPSYSTDSNYVIAKFKLQISPDAQVGLNTLKVKVITSEGEYNYEFNILIEDSNPKLNILQKNKISIEPGKSKEVSFEIENINSIPLRDLFVTLDLENVDNKIFGIDGSSNVQTLLTLNPKEKKMITFNLNVNPTAESRNYLLPVKIEYKDSLNNNYSTKALLSINVYSKPILSLNLESQEKFSKGLNKLTLAIANPGTSTIKGTKLEILDSSNYNVIEGKNNYVGDLNPDDFQTIIAKTYINSDKKTNLKIKLTYFDSYNNLIEETREIPVQIYSAEKLKELGLNKNQSNLNFTTIFLIIIFLVIGFIIGTYRAKKTNKKK